MSKKEKLQSPNSTESEAEMSFLEHLEELRWRIIYALIGVVIGTIIAWIFIDFFINQILLLPAKQSNFKLQNLRPFGQLFLFFEVALIIGLICSLSTLEIYYSCSSRKWKKIYFRNSYFYYYLFLSRRSVCILCYASAYITICCSIRFAGNSK